jgi:mRNA interferase RelE/StbE
VSYRIRVPRRVQKELDALPEVVYARVREHIQRLSDNPRPTGVKKLKGRADSYRIRIGAYRVVYEVDDPQQEITLITVSDRKDVYR